MDGSQRGKQGPSLCAPGWIHVGYADSREPRCYQCLWKTHSSGEEGLGNFSLANTKAGAEEGFLLLGCMAMACAKGMCFHRHRCGQVVQLKQVWHDMRPISVLWFRISEGLTLLILRGGTLRPKGNSQEIMSQRILVRIILVGRSGVAQSATLSRA